MQPVNCFRDFCIVSYAKDSSWDKQYIFKTYLKGSWKAGMDDTDKHLKVADKPAHKGK